MRPFILTILMVLATLPNWVHAQAGVAIFSINEKFVPELGITDETTLHLHAGRGEYVGFQIAISGSGSVPAPAITSTALQVQAYEQYFFPIQDTKRLAYSPAYIHASQIADGLRAMGDTLTQNADGYFAVWVDVFVPSETAPGEYSVEVSVNGVNRSIPVTVYDVTLMPSGAMTVMIPLSDGFTLDFYSAMMGVDKSAYHDAVNQLLADHLLVSGSLNGTPRKTESGWDFSDFTAQINAIPVGMQFHTPIPFDEATGKYYINTPAGIPYVLTDWNDPVFTAELEKFFTDLHAYLASLGRLEDALVYPNDESFWVADEPDNNGPQGHEHLARWTAIIQRAGLRVTASRVLPVAWAPDWTDPNLLTNDSHVHIDYFDAAPILFADWARMPGRSTSVYLNQYGDLIDLSAAIHRGLIWHAYGRNVKNITGYAELEWVDESFGLYDPYTNPQAVESVFGYGVGALIYPDPSPSTRIKFLREGVEDARLLQQYSDTFGADLGRELARCLTPQEIAYSQPDPALWETVHTALLQSISSGVLIDPASTCLPAPTYAETRMLVDFDGQPGEWEYSDVNATDVSSPFGTGNAMQMEFLSANGENSAFWWFGNTDWSGYSVIQLDVSNESDYFTALDVALGDDDSNYLLLRGDSNLIPPRTQMTLTIPLMLFPDDETFNFSKATYLDLNVGVEITRRNGNGEVNTYNTGDRTLIIDNIRLAR
ncbi:MAG: hypothetical protein ACOYLB_13305 [Phototrophicaceae bacterium]